MPGLWVDQTICCTRCYHVICLCLRNWRINQRTLPKYLLIEKTTSNQLELISNYQVSGDFSIVQVWKYLNFRCLPKRVIWQFWSLFSLLWWSWRLTTWIFFKRPSSGGRVEYLCRVNSLGGWDALFHDRVYMVSKWLLFDAMPSVRETHISRTQYVTAEVA